MRIIETSESLDSATITVTHQRDPDTGKVVIIVVLPGGETFKEAIWAQEVDERARFISELCAAYPGIHGERQSIRKELVKIARATEIDLRFNTHPNPNGSCRASARLWAGRKLIETVAVDLMAPASRGKAIKHLAPFVAGRNAGKKKLSASERALSKLFMAELQRVLSQPAQQPRNVREVSLYRDDGQGIVMRTPAGEIPLTNFSARIVAVVIRTDGHDQRNEFELEVKTGEAVRQIFVSTKEFNEMKWPIEQLHADGFIAAGRGAADHARAAIMLFSRDPKPQEKTIHTHTGWLKVKDAWAYLHAGGVITSDPQVKIEVSLPSALSRYILPEPPAGAALKAAIRASLRLLDLGPGHVMTPGYCAIWRSVLGHGDMTVFTVGPSGTFKSELSALRLQHFGAGLDRLHLPAGWSSTATALELLTFAAKDALIVIDDFAPQGSKNQVDALHALADRVLRSQANGTGRARSSKMLQVDSPKAPRGICLSTGEDRPRGSIVARNLIEELSPGQITPARLTACQRDARDGLYASAMAGYIRWLCENSRIERIQKTLSDDKDRLRDHVRIEGTHFRTPDAAANLALGAQYFLQFALEVGAVTDEEHGAHWKRIWMGLLECANRMPAHTSNEDPARRFLDLISSAIVSGEAHLSDTAGSCPCDELAPAMGWFRPMSGAAWQPKGLWIGCIDEDGEIYLDGEAAYKVAQRAGEGLVIGSVTLRKRLQEKGYLQGCADKRNTVRKRVKGAIRMMLWLAQGAMGVELARTARTADSAIAENRVFEAPEGVES